MRDRFLHGEAAQVALAGAAPIVDGALVAAGLFEMLRQHFRRRVDDVRDALFQHQRDRGMQLLPAGAQHGRIGAVLHQRVLEDVDRVRRRAAQKNHLGFGEPDQCVLQHGVGQAGDRGQDLIGEFAADGGADLQDLARRTEPVDARHQRGLQRRGNGERLRRLFEHVAVACILQLSLSSTALVSSSTNSGTPSVRSTI